MRVLLFLFPLLGAAELVPLLRRRQTPEAAAVGAITCLGALYAAGAVFAWPLPNPAQLITALFRPLALALGFS